MQLDYHSPDVAGFKLLFSSNTSHDHMVASALTNSSMNSTPLMSSMEINPLYWKASTLILTIFLHHSCKKTCVNNNKEKTSA